MSLPSIATLILGVPCCWPLGVLTAIKPSTVYHVSVAAVEGGVTNSPAARLDEPTLGMDWRGRVLKVVELGVFTVHCQGKEGTPFCANVITLSSVSIIVIRVIFFILVFKIKSVSFFDLMAMVMQKYTFFMNLQIS